METIEDLLKRADRAQLEKWLVSAAKKLPDLEDKIRLKLQKQEDIQEYFETRIQELLNAWQESLDANLAGMKRRHFRNWEDYDYSYGNQYRKLYRLITKDAKKFIKEAVGRSDSLLFLEGAWVFQQFALSHEPEEDGDWDYVYDIMPELGDELIPYLPKLSQNQIDEAIVWCAKRKEEDPDGFEPFESWYEKLVVASKSPSED